MRAAVTTLCVCVALLLALGTVMLCSSPAGSKLLAKQLIWCAVGIVVCIVATAVDYRHLKKAAIPLYGVSLILLAAVLLTGKRGGASRWFTVGPMLFQPSELAKLSLVIALAHYGAWRQRQMENFAKGLLLPAAFVVPMLALLLLEPDFGTTILLSGVSAIVLLTAGVRWVYIVPNAMAGAAAIALFIRMDPNRWQRIVAYLNPQQHKGDTGYQAYQAMLALASGGLWGVGLGNGTLKLGYVPENHTDFIFSIVGEEMGLVATLAVVLVFIVMVICGVTIALNSGDPFGLYLGVGLTFLIGLQAFINIGVVCSALPNKGLPLPFVSYGGSNLVMMLASFGLLLNIARHAGDTAWAGSASNPFSSSEPFDSSSEAAG